MQRDSAGERRAMPDQTLDGAASGNTIAAVTQALWQLLHRQLGAVTPAIKITARSPDRARDQDAGPQVNLFLYQVAEDRSLASGGRSDLALNLYYLVSAYGPEDHEINSSCHAALTAAMRVFHDNPIVFPNPSPTAPAHPVHVALHPLSLDDLCKLWTIFQMPYQISVVYEVSSLFISGVP
jgi:hypothetical protein